MKKITGTVTIRIDRSNLYHFENMKNAVDGTLPSLVTKVLYIFLKFWSPISMGIF